MFLLLLSIIIICSNFSVQLWDEKPETLPDPGKLLIDRTMTLEDFGQANNLPNPLLKKIFGLKAQSDLQKQLSNYGTIDQIQLQIEKELHLATEHETKNWLKILIKFFLWFAFLVFIFFFFRKRKFTPAIRKRTLFIAVLIFGVVMGSDPSPMGTVKDAIHLFGSIGAVFPPRMIALTVFLLIVFAANKYICGWGCQLGVLQDLIFHLNRSKQKNIIGHQIKMPFVFSNSIRILYLGIFTTAAFAWGIDLIEPLDPFKIYKPAVLELTGIIFIGTLLLLSLFVYRPWCHLFCPFGLIGWLAEKFSRIRISVDYNTCIACQKCENACPSTVMHAILKQNKKTIPDCFACYTCRNICPTDSIQFSSRKRTMPPVGHFEKKKKLK